MTKRANLYIDQGINFTATIDLTDENIVSIGDANNTFASDVSKVYSASSQFSLGASASSDSNNDILYVTCGSAATANVEPGKYRYDVLMTKTDGEVVKILEGMVFLIPTITR